MAIAKSKKRYLVSLTVSNVERFQSLCRDIGLPPGTMSNACDDIIRDLCDVFQEAKDTGKMSINDIFRLMGKQMELLMEEERKEKEDAGQKRNKNSGKSKR